ncbi:hypothetical protein MNBD_DELTA03-1177 [hydrothermal vent metagenome]|uniref:CopG family transcriptional regulator n=1 Tax=hydrothermal vent metagenome TaxID=652676 RepID=A0A3B0URZ6_9ZZZZ
MTRIEIDKDLYKQLQDCSEAAGFSSVDDFIIHILKKEVAIYENVDDDPNIMERLKELGSIA